LSIQYLEFFEIDQSIIQVILSMMRMIMDPWEYIGNDLVKSLGLYDLLDGKRFA